MASTKTSTLTIVDAQSNRGSFVRAEDGTVYAQVENGNRVILAPEDIYAVHLFVADILDPLLNPDPGEGAA